MLTVPGAAESKTSDDSGDSNQPTDSAGKDKLPNGLPIRWVGSQIDLKKAWLFFEIKATVSNGQFELENRLFLKSNEEQVNHVRIKSGSDIQWFKSDHKQQKMSFEIS